MFGQKLLICILYLGCMLGAHIIIDDDFGDNYRIISGMVTTAMFIASTMMLFNL